MKFNPFEEKPVCFEKQLVDWQGIYPKAYNKDEADPYTKLRIILMNGTEYEAVWFSHSFHRHCTNNDLRRELALMRRIEQQQQKKISCMKPINENILETTIGYEQLAVDLTAALAISEPDPYVKAALDFALLEDFDHLYRYADLLDMEQGIKAESLVNHYTEIMPGRPTVSEHRNPMDSVKNHINSRTAAPITKLNVAIITAAEQQTMNYYMNQAGFYTSDLGRRLYQEIAMIEEQHVSHYGSLLDSSSTLLECLLMHEYTECYLYYSCYMDEICPNAKRVWEQHLVQEISHLHKAAELLKKYEKKEWQQVIPDGCFPASLQFKPQKEYVRSVLQNTAHLTADKENYIPVKDLPKENSFSAYQSCVNTDIKQVPSHAVICSYISSNGKDYRYEIEPNPIRELQSRSQDNTTVGRECIGS